jgi:hypothetical protein
MVAMVEMEEMAADLVAVEVAAVEEAAATMGRMMSTDAVTTATVEVVAVTAEEAVAVEAPNSPPHTMVTDILNVFY